jgi:ABC-2 type transport system permease protein
MTAMREREHAAPAVPVTPGGLGHELRAIAMVWRREMIRFRRDRARMVAMLLQPVLFLFVMGTGLAGVVDPAGGMDFRTFLFPGVLAISVLFSAAFAGISLVWDREFGFLREMLVAPVSKTAIIMGKCLGGATVATLQSLVLLALAGTVGVPYHPLMLVTLLALLFVGALMLTALGVLISARIKQVQAAMPASQLIIMPMMFLSGALFPLSNLPAWLATLTTLNPLTYVVQPMRAVVFEFVGASEEARTVFDTTITWGAWDLPVGAQVAVALAATAGLVAAGIALFNRNE